MALKTLPFDAADAPDTPALQAELLADALASGDAKVVTAALGMIARARGVTQMARDTGLSREAIYRATGPDGNPTLFLTLPLIYVPIMFPLTPSPYAAIDAIPTRKNRHQIHPLKPSRRPHSPRQIDTAGW